VNLSGSDNNCIFIKAYLFYHTFSRNARANEEIPEIFLKILTKVGLWCIIYVFGCAWLPRLKGISLEMSDSRAMMQDGDLRKRFKTRRFQDGKILARNDLYREF